MFHPEGSHPNRQKAGVLWRSSASEQQNSHFSGIGHGVSTLGRHSVQTSRPEPFCCCWKRSPLGVYGGELRLRDIRSCLSFFGASYSKQRDSLRGFLVQVSSSASCSFFSGFAQTGLPIGCQTRTTDAQHGGDLGDQTSFRSARWSLPPSRSRSALGS